nr:MAG TPA: hypothetical protein [Caudoviricetes sp.]
MKHYWENKVIVWEMYLSKKHRCPQKSAALPL